MGTETTGEQAVAVAHVHDVIGAAVRKLDAAGEAIAPALEVAVRVATDRGDAGSAR